MPKAQKKKETSVEIRGRPGDSPQQTILKAEQALAKAKASLLRIQQLESNPLVQEFKRLNEAQALKKPLTGGIKKRKTGKKAAKKRITKAKGKSQPKKKKAAKSGVLHLYL